MSHCNTIFNQLLNLLPGHAFEKLVEKQQSDRYAKTFKADSQLKVLLYAQASGKNSLREIEHSLLRHSSKLYHLGLPAKICKSTLSDANKRYCWKIYEALFYKLLERCQSLTPRHRFKFKNPLISWDASVIDLCLSVVPWAKFRKAKGAIKLHCALDHNGHIPSFMSITHGKKHEVSVAKQQFKLTPDSIYCFDKGYCDFSLFRQIHDDRAFFVTRAKDNLQFITTGQHKPFKNKAVISDEIVELAIPSSFKSFPHKLRLIRFHDKQKDKVFEFITNNFKLAPATIAQIYKDRWYIEAFFKFIKQNLKIKTFLGTSKNAVLSQVWIAVCYFLLLNYIKFQSKYKPSVFYLNLILKDTILHKFNLIEVIHFKLNQIPYPKSPDPQLLLL